METRKGTPRPGEKEAKPRASGTIPGISQMTRRKPSEPEEKVAVPKDDN